MGHIYLNALPLDINGSGQTVIGRRWQREDEIDSALHADPDRGQAFHHYSLARHSYLWAPAGGDLPAAYRDRGSEVQLQDLPAAVVAFAARQAAIDTLVEKGFELLGARIGHPARLSRRKRNLAAGIVGRLPKGVGAFAAIAVQGLALSGDDREPGEVALIVDQWIEHALDVPLPELSGSGIELIGLRVRWRHAADCDCGEDPPVGDAGRVIGGDASGDVILRSGGGDQFSTPARCLAAHANTKMLARYLASLNGRGERDISEALYKATSEFAKTNERWKNLEKTAQAFGELGVFVGVSAKLRTPLLVPSAPKPGGTGPVTLPAVSERTLNFQYGSPKLHKNAAQGLRDHGPYDEGQQRTDILKAVIVAPTEFEAEARKLRRILDQGIQSFKGLKERYHLREFDIELETFPHATRSGYQNAVLAAAKGGPDIVFFVTKYDFRYARRGENPYLAAKAVLASSAIASQAVTVETLNRPDNSLQWSSDSVGLAAYTKVGNIPYVLHDPEGSRELVLGVGRADVYDYENGGRRQRFGASVAVRQDGDFLYAGSTTPVDEDEDYQSHLTRLITENIERFSKEQAGDPDRLVVYLFKRTGRRELWALQKAIGDRNIEFALLHVNRDSPLWLVERTRNRMTPPERGTTIALTDNDRLLITGDPKKAASHPLRLTLDHKSTYRDMDRLVQQAFGFTKTSYRGFLQSNEPSPILFGRLLAQKVEDLIPYGFNPATAAGPLGDRPWFI